LRPAASQKPRNSAAIPSVSFLAGRKNLLVIAKTSLNQWLLNRINNHECGGEINSPRMDGSVRFILPISLNLWIFPATVGMFRLFIRAGRRRLRFFGVWANVH